ncbi:hypothetical protein QWY28_13790 [Nocardioides sp. SOB77]|uniref:Uncharacterized protein n=1 Tax=Nocardioides oceani TaxID=3058369 RepID=A0ABT8FH74_9ACTN|nr:hypothetical protein [Nocardioides oceani]MDN4174028.1 hypothetical protein [Nocardioides oceani]
MKRSTDTWRRAVSLALAVLCLVLAPQVAHAVFAARQAPAGTPVSVARMAPVTAFTGSLTCDSRFLQRNTAEVTINAITDTGQLRLPIVYSVEASRNGSASATLTGKTGSVVLEQAYTPTRMAIDITVTASYRSWSTSMTRSVSCPFLNLGTTNF